MINLDLWFNLGSMLLFSLLALVGPALASGVQHTFWDIDGTILPAGLPVILFLFSLFPPELCAVFALFLSLCFTRCLTRFTRCLTRFTRCLTRLLLFLFYYPSSFFPAFPPSTHSMICIKEMGHLYSLLLLTMYR